MTDPKKRWQEIRGALWNLDGLAVSLLMELKRLRQRCTHPAMPAWLDRVNICPDCGLAKVSASPEADQRQACSGCGQAITLPAPICDTCYSVIVSARTSEPPPVTLEAAFRAGHGCTFENGKYLFESGVDRAGDAHAAYLVWIIRITKILQTALQAPPAIPCGDMYKGRRCLLFGDHVGITHTAADGTCWWSEDK